MDTGQLSYALEGQIPQNFDLRPGVTTIGRAPENDVVLDAPGVAPYHVRILCSANECWVQDLDTPGGTLLNQVRLRANARYPLRNGDILRIGPFYVRISNLPKREDLQNLVDDLLSGEQNTRRQQLLPPQVAARLTQTSRRTRRGGQRLPARQLRGNLPPPKIPVGGSFDTGVSSYLPYLPPPYQDNLFLAKFLLIFETMLTPLERQIGDIHRYFDPRMAPEAMLPWLASWLDLVLNENWPMDRRRELVARAAELYRWRGTRRGLTNYIQTYTGVRPTIVETLEEANALQLPPPPANVFYVIVELPPDSPVTRELLQLIIENEKPAHTAYLLELRTGAPVS